MDRDRRLDLVRLVRLRERQAFFHAGDHRLVDLADLAEVTFTLRALGRGEVTQTRLAPHDFACRGYFEPLGHCFFRLATCD